MSEPRIGDTYFGVRCRSCGKPILLYDDPSRGRKPITFQGPGKVSATCPAGGCGRQHEYGTDELQRFEVTGLG